MIRIGEIPYANCVPIFAALRKMHPEGSYRYHPGEPTTLNRRLFAGEIDLAPASSLEYALHPDQYLLVPDLSISSGREVQSVLLISQVPVEDLGGRTVRLSPASASSNALVRILLEKHYGIHCHYAYDDRTEGDPPAAGDARVTIGDGALKAYLNPRRDTYLYDLASLWHQFTGLPFVFALWLVRREAVEREPEEMDRLVKLLGEARDYAVTHFAELARESEKALKISAADLRRYWEGISFDLGPEKIDSLRRYYDEAAQLGLLLESPPFHFFPKPEQPLL